MGALVLAEYRKPETDLFRIVELIAVHDIVEIYAGDTFFYSAEGYETKKQREEEAIAQLVALLPADQAETFAALWYEFETNETLDANFANAVDQLMPALLNSRNNGLSWTENNIAKTQVEQKMNTVTQASETLSDILKDAIARSVEKGLLR
jgi:putative hydrolases of HD superfamily